MKFLENRIPPPIVMVIFGGGMYGVAGLLPVTELSGIVRFGLTLAFSILGLAMLLAGAVSFRLAKTTVNPLKPEQASSLVTSGVYRITRNPMYVGFAALLAAWACYLASAWSFAFVAGYVLYIHRFQIQPEERALTKLFGDEFDVYRSQVRAWL